MSDPKSEADAQYQIRLALGSREDVLVLRNHVAVATTSRGATQRFGLGVGSPDLVGVQRIVIPACRCKTQEGVDTTDIGGSCQAGEPLVIGRFFGIEVKGPKGRLRKEQKQWLEMAKGYGAVAGVARNTEEALLLLGLGRNCG